MTAPQSTPLPQAPQRNEPEDVFIPKSNAWVAAQEQLRTELQAQADFVNTKTVDLNSAVVAAEASASASLVSEGNSSASETSAAADALAASNSAAASEASKVFSTNKAHEAGLSESSALTSAANAKDSEIIAQSAGNYIGVWSSLTGPVAAGVSVAHNGQYWGSLVSIADITLAEPSISADWQAIGGELGTAATKDTGVAAEQVPTNADLGTAATKDVATNAEALAGTSGVLTDAAGVRAAFKQYGLGSRSLYNAFKSELFGSGFFGVNSSIANNPVGGDGLAIVGCWSSDGAGAGEQTLYISRNAPVKGWLQTKPVSSSPYSAVEILTTGNTTVDGNGFIKQASPIVKLHSDRMEKNGEFVANFEKIDTGHYLIKNTLGFAQSGWYIETPKDANGNLKVFVEYTDNDGDITVKTYEPDYSTGRATAGAPMDIPADRWIDLRLHELPPEPVDEESEE